MIPEPAILLLSSAFSSHLGLGLWTVGLSVNPISRGEVFCIDEVDPLTNLLEPRTLLEQENDLLTISWLWKYLAVPSISRALPEIILAVADNTIFDLYLLSYEQIKSDTFLILKMSQCTQRSTPVD